MAHEEEVALVVAVLKHPAGYNLDFAAHLGIRSTDQGTIEVEWTEYEVGDSGKSQEMVKSFPESDLEEAAKFYVEMRHELQYGLDYESEAWLKAKAEGLL